MRKKGSTLYPDNEVLKGCVYHFMIESPGKSEKWGLLKNYGSDTASFWQLKALQNYFKMHH
jgi:hypothetical protein